MKQEQSERVNQIELISVSSLAISRPIHRSRLPQGSLSLRSLTVNRARVKFVNIDVHPGGYGRGVSVVGGSGRRRGDGDHDALKFKRLRAKGELD